MSNKSIVIEVFYHYPEGRWVIYGNEDHPMLPVSGRPMTLVRAKATLRKRSQLEEWQERTYPGLIDNSDRSYRLRNIETGEIITPDQVHFYFGRRPTSANSRPMSYGEATAPSSGMRLLDYLLLVMGENPKAVLESTPIVIRG